MSDVLYFLRTHFHRLRRCWCSEAVPGQRGTPVQRFSPPCRCRRSPWRSSPGRCWPGGVLHLDVGLGLDELLVDVANDVDLGDFWRCHGSGACQTLFLQWRPPPRATHMPMRFPPVGVQNCTFLGDWTSARWEQALTGDRLLQLGEDEIKEQRQQGNRDGAQVIIAHSGVEGQIDKPAQTLGAGGTGAWLVPTELRRPMRIPAMMKGGAWAAPPGNRQAPMPRATPRTWR